MPARRSDAAAPRELRARGLATRERLLDAGATVFANRGVHAARVDDIVKVAATSHGTFYLYFANKEELFHALAEQVAGELEALAGTTAGAHARPGRRRRARRVDARSSASSTPAPGRSSARWTETEMVATAMGRLGTVVWAAFTERARRADPGDGRRRHRSRDGRARARRDDRARQLLRAHRPGPRHPTARCRRPWRGSRTAPSSAARDRRWGRRRPATPPAGRR